MNNLLTHPLFAWTGIVFWAVVVIAVTAFAVALTVTLLREYWLPAKHIVYATISLIRKNHIKMGHFSERDLEIFHSIFWSNKKNMPIGAYWIYGKIIDRVKRERKEAGLNI